MKMGLRIIILLGIMCATWSAAPLFAHAEIEVQIRELDRRIEQKPADAELYLQRGELHRIHRNWKGAEADYMKVREMDPGMVIVEYCLGRMKLESGHPDQARSLLKAYLEKRPHDSAALAVRGRAMEQLGKHMAAAEDFSRAIEHASGANLRPELYLERARSLMASGPEKLNDAIAGLDEGLEKLGEPVALQLYAIDLESAAGRYDAAIRRIDRLASQATRQEPWLMRKGAVLETAGRNAAAVEFYRKALNAIERLPQSRRGSRAVQGLEAEARAAIERLDGEQISQ
jgi:predicted Zn-dependent protease